MSSAAGSLTGRTTRAVQWRLTGSAVGAVSQLGIGVLLARLLTPADFGVVALAFVVLGLARPLGDLGIGGALVQRSTLTERHVRTAFTCSVLMGLVLMLVVSAAAPLCAAMTRDPKVVSVLRLLAIGFPFQGAGVVAWALLRRRLDFRTQCFIDVGSYLVGYGGVAVSLALLGGGVASLAWGGLCQTLLASLLQLASVRHSLRPLLARRELAELLQFGIGSAALGCVNYIALNGDNFVVGRWMGAASLGLYGRAYTTMNLPYTYASSVMSSVLFPAFAEVQGEPARLRRAFLRTTELTATFAAASMGTMAIVAPHLVRALYGSRWEGMVVPLQILCFAGYFRALYHLGGVVAQSVGRVYSELWRQAIYAFLVITGSVVGSRYGLSWVAVGVSAAILYMFVATAQLALNATGVPWSRYFRVQVRALSTAAATSGVALIARLLVETSGASSLTITLAVLGAAAVPWSIGVLWILADPDFEGLSGRLPRFGVWLVEAVRSHRPGSPSSVRAAEMAFAQRVRTKNS